jgi:hypothetical protein
MWEKGGPDFNTRLAYQAGLTSFFHTKKDLHHRQVFLQEFGLNKPNSRTNVVTMVNPGLSCFLFFFLEFNQHGKGRSTIQPPYTNRIGIRYRRHKCATATVIAGDFAIRNAWPIRDLQTTSAGCPVTTHAQVKNAFSLVRYRTTEYDIVIRIDRHRLTAATGE